MNTKWAFILLLVFPVFRCECEVLAFDLEISIYDRMQQEESFKGRLFNYPNGDTYLVIYWHEPMIRHSWENGPFGCSEWFLREGKLHYWLRDDGLSGPRKGVLDLVGAAARPFSPRLRQSVLAGLDVESVSHFLAANLSSIQGTETSSMPALLWSQDALKAFWSNSDFKGEIEPESVSTPVDSVSGSIPQHVTFEQFPPFGRSVRVVSGADGTTYLEVRRLLDDVPVLTLKRTVVTAPSDPEFDAVQPEGLGSFHAAPEPFHEFWQLQGELERLDRAKSEPALYGPLWAKARDALTEELPKPLGVATAQIYTRAAASAVDLANTTTAVEAFLAAANGSNYERWSVYEVGQAIDILLDSGISQLQLEPLVAATANMIVINGYMGDEQSTTMLVDDLIASGWPFYAEKLVTALEEQGSDAEFLVALRSRLQKSTKRSNYVLRAPETAPKVDSAPE